MIVDITPEEKKEITRCTMDRLLYCKGYKEELLVLNSKYDPHKDTKFTYEAEKSFLFPLDKAI